MTPKESTISSALPTLADIEAKAYEGLHPRLATAAPLDYGFNSWLWARYKDVTGLTWDKAGTFHGRLILEIIGGRDYRYTPDSKDPFRFVRANGETIRPGSLVTDGGTIPRIAWLLTDIDPRAYIKGYILHDWLCALHHCRPDYEYPARSFADVNNVLGEAIYTLMMIGEVAADWRRPSLVHAAVQGPYGRSYWDLTWSKAKCELYLPQG